MPCAIHGWRPISVVYQPARMAMKPSGQAYCDACRYQRVSNSRPRDPQPGADEAGEQHQHADADHDAEGRGRPGRPAAARTAGIPSSPGTGRRLSCVRIKLAHDPGWRSRSRCVSSAELGMAKSTSGAGLGAVPVALDGRHLGRLMLQAVLSPCWSPMKTCSGARMATMPSPMRIMVLASSGKRPLHEIARADRQHHQRGGEIGGGEHVREAVGEARIEDDLRSSRPDRRCR